MSTLAFVLCLLMVMAPSIWFGYVWGFGRGEDDGYRRGYHEGSFDAEIRS